MNHEIDFLDKFFSHLATWLLTIGAATGVIINLIRRLLRLRREAKARRSRR
jgi:hypothetical protein